MKVAFVNNMNNNFFSFVRFLRDRGVDAELLMPHGYLPHFHPSTDTYSVKYMEYTRYVDWGEISYFSKVNVKRLRDDLAPYDFIVGCGDAPALLHKAEVKLDAFFPYGGDIALMPYRKSRFLGCLHPQAKAQRAAIQKVPLIIRFRNPDHGDKLMKLGFQGEYRDCLLPLLYTPQYNPVSIKNHYGKTHWFDEVESIRKQHDLVIFHHSRQTWFSAKNTIDDKGNDRLFRGGASFVKHNPGIKLAVVALDFGPDTERSKALVRELGIEANVFWLPQMFRKDIMVAISFSDIVASQFVNSWIGGSTLFEGQAMEKPILTYRDDPFYKNDDLFPIMNASTPVEIEQRLADYVESPETFKRMGQEGRLWLQSKMDDTLNFFLNYIGKTS